MENRRNLNLLNANGTSFAVVTPIIDSADRPNLKSGLASDSFILNRSYYRLGTINDWVSTGVDIDLVELTNSAGNYEVTFSVADITAFQEIDKTKPIVIYLKPGAGVNADPVVLEVYHDINANTTVQLEELLDGQVGQNISSIASTMTVTTGSVTSGNLTSTKYVDGDYLITTDLSGVLEINFEFDITNQGSPNTVSILGNLRSSNDELTVLAYDTSISAFAPLGIFKGKNNDAFKLKTYSLNRTMVGTGADLGKVEIKIYSNSLTGATFKIEQILTDYSIINNSVGYANGAVWLDTNSAYSGAVPFVDGLADHKTNSLANAITLCNTVGLSKIIVSQGSVISLDRNITNLSITGIGYTFSPNGHTTTDCVFVGATISEGCVFTKGNGSLIFNTCLFNNATIPLATLEDCRYGATLTLADAGNYLFIRPISAVAGEGSPKFNLTNLGQYFLSFRSNSGGVEIEHLKTNDKVTIEGHGQVITNANCSGGSISIRGSFNKTDNSNGAVTFYDNARFGMDQFTEMALQIKEVHSYATLDLDYDTGTHVRVFKDVNGDELFRVQTDETGVVYTRKRL
jgi:hypothetical protein